jgi:hypothetical protein
VVTLKDDGVLTGLKEICCYVNRTRGTVLRLVRDEGLPAEKIQGVWYSDRALIVAWMRGRIRPVKGKDWSSVGKK